MRNIICSGRILEFPDLLRGLGVHKATVWCRPLRTICTRLVRDSMLGCSHTSPPRFMTPWCAWVDVDSALSVLLLALPAAQISPTCAYAPLLPSLAQCPHFLAKQCETHVASA